MKIKRSEETKAKNSKAKQGILTSEKAREMAKMKIGTRQTQETKDKISKSLKNKIVRQETKDKMTSGGLEYMYYLKDPDGIRYITDNMKKFAKDFNLDKSHMLKICSGKEHQYKGWICIKREKLIK